jgi:hypothetical protein
LLCCFPVSPRQMPLVPFNTCHTNVFFGPRQYGVQSFANGGLRLFGGICGHENTNFQVMTNAVTLKCSNYCQQIFSWGNRDFIFVLVGHRSFERMTGGTRGPNNCESLGRRWLTSGSVFTTALQHSTCRCFMWAGHFDTRCNTDSLYIDICRTEI